MKMHLWIVCCALTLSACRGDTPLDKPEPVTMTRDALGHYCQMHLYEHPGPKAQVHLAGLPEPLFFAQVRDAIAYQRMPEQTHTIRAIYVSDMAKAQSWSEPGIDNWTSADEAIYVVGSRKSGGMGAAELVPFSDKIAADDFMKANGGKLLKLSQISDDMVLSPVDMTLDESGNFIPPSNGSNPHN